MKNSSFFFILLISILLTDCGRPDLNGPGKANPADTPARSLRYHPEGGDFVIVNGERKFNRALYGTNTGFRVETGDLPEFAMYLRGMGGNFKLGLESADTSLWLTSAAQITARYRAGSMLYEVRDPVLGNGVLHLRVLALAGGEGMVVRAGGSSVPGGLRLIWAYGGASGKYFSREGDLGADPESSFDLKPEYCRGNRFETDENTFTLHFTSVRSGREEQVFGLLPPGGTLKVCDADAQDAPLTLLRSVPSDKPVIAGSLDISKETDLYFVLSRESRYRPGDYAEAAGIYERAEQTRADLAGRIRVHTPDDFINNYGPALSMAADAIWEDPSYLHGAVAWRRRLQGWRGAYAGDWLGWHDRARKHFEGYAAAQYTAPDSAPAAPDPATHLARQEEKKGKSLFTSGYISRNPHQFSDPHHYDMNLVLIDQLLWHIQWTGDLDFAREMWPVLRRHLAWEKRCFDGNGDGLYDAYASIWASDALQYSGGGVTHSSSYNYRGNLLAAKIARLMGEDPEPYLAEAEKILQAVNRELWIQEKGWYGEYKDLLGYQRIHSAPAIWTIYHALDADLPDPFQAWQSLRYVNHHIPRIPANVKELPGEEFHSLSTSSWMPYEWSINNVALAENLHMALAYWQGGDPETAFRLWKSQVLESMYLGGSPGNFHQLSSLDVFRGELYRDFADPVGMAARTLVEGLFGIRPQLLDGKILIEPGFPAEWEFASLETPDITLDYKRKRNQETYVIRHAFPHEPRVVLSLPALSDRIGSLTVNGTEAEFSPAEGAVGTPRIEVSLAAADKYHVRIRWKGDPPEKPDLPSRIVTGDTLQLSFKKARITDVHDPQFILAWLATGDRTLRAGVEGTGHRTCFFRAEQGDLSWWMPVGVEIREALEIVPPPEQTPEGMHFRIRNNTFAAVSGQVTVTGSGDGFLLPVSVDASGESGDLEIPSSALLPGTNRVNFSSSMHEAAADLVNWEIPVPAGTEWRTIGMEEYFNDRVTSIFSNRYLSPRCPHPTLQLPVQGIGDWCSYAKTATIDDSGLRQKAGQDQIFEPVPGIPVRTPGDAGVPNIVFTSLWDNYPDSAVIPLDGRASHAYLLMAGSTHHMQSRIANGEVGILYKDGTCEKLELVNPDTWWPIEQDYYTDDHAFRVEGARPPRVHLKTGEVPREPYRVLAVNKTNLIDGGAATLLDLPLDPCRELQSLQLRTLSNDVVIGLMAVTLAAETDRRP